MKIKKHITFSNGNPVWRILISKDDLLFLETRDIKSKEVFFHIVNLKNGKNVVKSYQPAEKFWIGVEEFADDLILFHKFVKPDMPEHVGIIAYDYVKDNILWENEDLTYLFSQDNDIFCFKRLFERKEFYKINRYTGEVIQVDLSNAEINSMLAFAREKMDYKDYFFPVAMGNDETLNNLLSSMNFRDYNNHHHIEYILWKEVLLLSYHEQKENLFDNYLDIYNLEEGEKVKSYLLNKKSEKIIPESFFIYKNILFLLENKKQLTLYLLN